MHFVAFLIAPLAMLSWSAQDSQTDSDAAAPQPTIILPAEPVTAGQRQSSDQAAREAGITPVARVASRIENRVQSRINNRLARGSRPAANTTEAFVGGGEQVRRAGRSSRR